MVTFLAEHGFSSKLSLRYLDLETPEGAALLERLSLSQRCLLQGLIKLCHASDTNSSKKSGEGSGLYSLCAAKVRSAELFNFGRAKAPR